VSASQMELGSIREHWVTRRSAPWSWAFTSTASTKSIIQASACRQFSLNKRIALRAIKKSIWASLRIAGSI